MYIKMMIIWYNKGMDLIIGLVSFYKMVVVDMEIFYDIE